MNVCLMCPEGTPQPESLPAFDRDALKKDLALEIILDDVSGKDPVIRDAVTEALMRPLRARELVAYRHAVLADAEANPEEVRALYALCGEADRKNMETLGTLNWMQNYDVNSTFNGAVESLTVMTGVLKRLRKQAEILEPRFRSEGFLALFRMLQTELSDSYLDEARRRLSELRYPDSFLVGARLGSYLQGTDYVLLRPGKKLLLNLAVAAGYRLDEQDEPAKDIAARQARAVNEAANALAQSAVYLLDFFERLRSELAFYVGCLNLTARMRTLGMPLCRPVLTEADGTERVWEELYDMALAVSEKKAVTGNSLRASRKMLWLVTGANQGGKSTFLRSLGQAQLMAQCGMPVGAAGFTAPIRNAVYTHFKREEDRWMKRGKLDEELERMRKITDYIRKGDLLLLNESFSSTSEREGSEILRQITEALIESGVEAVSVTHLHTYASAFAGREDVQYLRAQRQEDGGRTHRILPGEPLETAFGMDLYREIFRA